MVFNWEINVTTGLALVGAAIAVGKFYFGTQNDAITTNKALENLEKVLGDGMSKLDKNIDSMNKVVMDLALSTQRQDNFERRTDERFARMLDDIREMKHGKGFIKDA